MAIPKYDEMMLPVLRILGDGAEHPQRELADQIADYFKLTPQERAERLPKVKATYLRHRLGSAGFSCSRGTDYKNVMIKSFDRISLLGGNTDRMEESNMKIRGFVLIMVTVALSFAPQFVNTSSAAGGYSSKLISPKLGQVLHPGQQIRIEWTPTFPRIHLNGSEMEIWLSLDGGRTFTTWLAFTSVNNTYYDWTVPNTPTNAAVLDIRFGREVPYYPETYSPQPASTFVIR